MKHLKYSVAVLAILPAVAQAQTDIKPIWESNLRSEQVEQVGFLNDAHAVTWRNRVGFEFKASDRLSFLIEAEDVRPLRNDYNSTLNGRTGFPTVLDPEVTELNRAQIVWTPTRTATLTVGRQRIQLDDQRFVGNVGWRQDEQTFDAVRLDTAAGPFRVTAAYVTRVNRVVAEARDWDSDSWLLNVSYPFSDALKLTAFGYVLDFDNAPASSTATWGLRASGKVKSGTWTYGYAVQYARQRDYANNPADFSLENVRLEGSATQGPLILKAGYETLGGNGVVGFITPLGTNHVFQGFSDVFSGTGGNKSLPDGIRDLNVGVSYAFAGRFKPSLSVTHHDFSTGQGGRELGTEWDAVAAVSVTPHLSVQLKYADFNAANPLAPASRRKTWLSLSYKL